MSNNPLKYEEFIIEEYKKTSEFHNALTEQITATLKQSYAYFTGLLVVLGYILLNYPGIILLTRLAGFAIPLMAILICIESINTLWNIRRREIWLYTRINYLRNIMLDSNKHVDPVRIYIESKQGSVKPFHEGLTWERFSRSEVFYNIKILLGFLSLWIVILLYFILDNWSEGNPLFMTWLNKFIIIFVIIIYIITRNIMMGKLEEKFEKEHSV